MRIRKIQFKNHPILKNLYLDFSFSQKDINIHSPIPPQAIIFTGLNGVGKTAILDSIYKICDFSPEIYYYLEYVEIDIFIKSIYKIRPNLKIRETINYAFSNNKKHSYEEQYVIEEQINGVWKKIWSGSNIINFFIEIMPKNTTNTTNVPV